MTPSYAVKKGTRYRYYVSRPLITQDQREGSTALRIPAEEIEHFVTSRVRQWLLDPGGIYQSTRLADPSTQRRLIARAMKIGQSWTELPGPRQRVFLTTLIERIDVGADRIDIQLRPTRLAALLGVAATPPPSATEDETQIVSVPIRLDPRSAEASAADIGSARTTRIVMSVMLGVPRLENGNMASVSGKVSACCVAAVSVGLKKL